MRFVLALVAAAAAMLPAAPRAQDEHEMVWYTVEVIVFERTGETGRNAESWPTEPGLPDLADTVELSVEGLALEALAGNPPTESEAPPETESVSTPLTPMPRAFQLVPPQEYRLTDAWNRLDKSSAFRPLVHLAWIQPGLPAEQARLVRLRNDNTTLGAIATGIATGIDGGAETPPASDDSGFSPTLTSRISVARDPSKVALDGNVRVHRARYLHVQADLLYYRPLDTDIDTAVPPTDDPDAAPLLDSPDTALIEQLLAEVDGAPRLFRLTESRRMRSRELHYLDHPLFGMLVEIWPVELPEAPAEAAAPLEGDLPADEGVDTQPPASLPASTQSGSGG
jgi:hypothetical protein